MEVQRRLGNALFRKGQGRWTGYDGLRANRLPFESAGKKSLEAITAKGIFGSARIKCTSGPDPLGVGTLWQ